MNWLLLLTAGCCACRFYPHSAAEVLSHYTAPKSHSVQWTWLLGSRTNLQWPEGHQWAESSVLEPLSHPGSLPPPGRTHWMQILKNLPAAHDLWLQQRITYQHDDTLKQSSQKNTRNVPTAQDWKIFCMKSCPFFYYLRPDTRTVQRRLRWSLS